MKKENQQRNRTATSRQHSNSRHMVNESDSLQRVKKSVKTNLNFARSNHHYGELGNAYTKWWKKQGFRYPIPNWKTVQWRTSESIPKASQYHEDAVEKSQTERSVSDRAKELATENTLGMSNPSKQEDNFVRIRNAITRNIYHLHGTLDGQEKAREGSKLHRSATTWRLTSQP